MPVKQSFEIKAREVNKGDFVSGRGTVTTRESKVKWTTITFSPRVTTPTLQETLRVENESAVTVIREVPTEEEQAAARVQRDLRTLDLREQGSRASLQAAREKMIENMESGKRASHWDWMDVPLAEAIVELWDAVTHVHLGHALHDQPITRVDAVRLVRDERTKQALQYYSALSRSTGVLSNLFDDIKTQALSMWTRDLEWVIAD